MLVGELWWLDSMPHRLPPQLNRAARGGPMVCCAQVGDRSPAVPALRDAFDDDCDAVADADAQAGDGVAGLAAFEFACGGEQDARA